jgi:hypothetical protein
LSAAADEKRGAITKVAARQIAELWAEDEKIVRIAVDKPRFRQRPVPRHNSTVVTWVAAVALAT